MNLHEGISSSCVPSRAYFCGFVRVLGFLVRLHMHVNPQQQPDIDRKPRNTPITTYSMDQSTIQFDYTLIPARICNYFTRTYHNSLVQFPKNRKCQASRMYHTYRLVFLNYKLHVPSTCFGKTLCEHLIWMFLEYCCLSKISLSIVSPPPIRTL